MAGSDTQRGVLLGMGAGILWSAAIWTVPLWINHPYLSHADTATRLAFWLPWEVLPLATLAYGIAAIARHRFFHADAIDGANPQADAPLARARAFLQNTLEQVVLGFGVHAALAVTLPSRWLAVLPALAISTVLCRILFRLGYAGGAAARSFGFAGTFYPTFIGIGVAAFFEFASMR